MFCGGWRTCFCEILRKLAAEIAKAKPPVYKMDRKK
jgi:hypothetical protein